MQVAIVKPPGYPHVEALREVAETLSDALRALNFGGGIIELPRYVGRITSRLIVLGAHLCYELPPDAIIYNLEQVGSAWFDAGYRELLAKHETWDYDAANAARFSSLGLPTPKVVPIGHMPCLTRISNLPPARQDIDVLFYGSINARRGHVIDALANRGVKVHRIFGYYGNERDFLIARSKIVLNLHYYDAQVFEMVRVSYLLANSKCVLSEGPVQPGLEGALAWADYSALVDATLGLLADEAQREALGAAGLAAMQSRPETAILAAALK
jgi:hypothetical protein